MLHILIGPSDQTAGYRAVVVVFVVFVVVISGECFRDWENY